jgi:dihydrofolate synthase/folylpolyglutamate synthase
MPARMLAELLAAEGIAEGVHQHPDPAAAFIAAREAAGENDRIVVFGSFLTVAGVMQVVHRS